MKIKIKECFGDLPSYLTFGKEYEVVDGTGRYVDILGDGGEDVYVDILECPHLNDGSWEIVE